MSRVTEQSARSEAVVALGKKLVAELGLGDSVDTLGRWMAHHVAELMEEAKAATGDDKLAKQALLREAILALWAHRFELPNGKRPFGEFEPILRALSSLDPESQSPRYFSRSRSPDNESDESKKTRDWIELAGRFDDISKILIDYCLTQAADEALDKSKEWVKLAREAGMEDSFDLITIRFFATENDVKQKSDPNTLQQRILADRKEKLELFLSVASALANDISARLSKLSPALDDEPPPRKRIRRAPSKSGKHPPRLRHKAKKRRLK